MAPSWRISSLGKKKVLFIMGTTGSGKSKLSISLGSEFPCEIINSDKIQVYRGLDIVTNKMPASQQGDIPHHLLGIIDDPHYDFTANEFCKHVHDALEHIIENGHIPIIVGGSNSYIEALVDDPKGEFLSKYDCCFIWLDVSLPVLYDYLDKRVDEMLDAGVVDEIRREAFDPNNADYSRGVRRAIGVPELHYYFHFIENDSTLDEAYKKRVLFHAIDTMKLNTHQLAKNQVTKIKRMVNELGWKMTRIDSTQIFEAVLRGQDYEHLYQEIVHKPSVEVARKFLEQTTPDRQMIIIDD